MQTGFWRLNFFLLRDLVKYWNVENLIHFHACTSEVYFGWLSEMKHCIHVFCQNKAFVIYKPGLLPVKLAWRIRAVLWFGDLPTNYKDLSHREPFLPNSVTVAIEALTIFLHVHLCRSWADKCLPFPCASKISRLQKNPVIFISLLIHVSVLPEPLKNLNCMTRMFIILIIKLFPQKLYFIHFLNR